MRSGSVGTPTGGNGGGTPPAPAVAPHAAKETVFASSVTAPFRASALPVRLAPVFIVMLVRARILPTNVVPTSIVAELLTCHSTPHAFAPFTRLTVAPGDVMRVLDIRKTKTALAFPCALSVSVPVKLD